VRRHARDAVSVAVCVFVLGACAKRSSLDARTGGDVARGEQIVRAYGCAACHKIADVGRPQGVVAPPLDAFARRTFIAGILPNTPANLVRWVVDPQAVDPRTAMPKLGLTQAQAQDVAAYLYTLD
jgi:cytochrome c2